MLLLRVRSKRHRVRGSKQFQTFTPYKSESLINYGIFQERVKSSYSHTVDNRWSHPSGWPLNSWKFEIPSVYAIRSGEYQNIQKSFVNNAKNVDQKRKRWPRRFVLRDANFGGCFPPVYMSWIAYTGSVERRYYNNMLPNWEFPRSGLIQVFQQSVEQGIRGLEMSFCLRYKIRSARRQENSESDLS